MKYIISYLILTPFLLVAYLYQNNPVVSSIVLTIGFGFSISYILKNKMWIK
jgi:hypothetical protein